MDDRNDERSEQPWDDDDEPEGGMTLRALAVPGATFVLTLFVLGALFWTNGATPLERFAPRGGDGWQAFGLLSVVVVLAVVVAGFLTSSIAALFLRGYVRRSKRLRRELVAACAAGLAPRLPTPGNAAQSVLFYASIEAYLHQNGAPALSGFLARGLTLCRSALASSFAILFASLACASIVQRALDLRVPLSVRWEIVASSLMAIALLLVITAAVAFVEHFAALLAWLRERARREIGLSSHPEAYLAASLPADFRSVRRGALAYVWALVAGSVLGLWCWGLWSAHSPVLWLVWIGALAAFASFIATFSFSWRRVADETRMEPALARETSAAAPVPAVEAPATPRKPVRGELELDPEPPAQPVAPALLAMVASQPHLERPTAKKDEFEALAKRTRGSEQWLEMRHDDPPTEPPATATQDPARAHAPAREEPPTKAAPAPAKPAHAPASTSAAHEREHGDAAAQKRREDVRAAVLRRLSQETPRRQAPPPSSSAPAEPADAADSDGDGPAARSATNGHGPANGASVASSAPSHSETAYLVSPHGLRATSAIVPGYLIEEELSLQGIGSEDPFAWAAFGLHAPRITPPVTDEDSAPESPHPLAPPATRTPARRPTELPPELPQDDLRLHDLRPTPPPPSRDRQRDPGTLLY